MVTKEDMLKAIDLGNYFKIPADNRDLNYDKYVNKGMTSFENAEDYNSHNTKQLDLKEMKQLLLQLDLFN